MGIAFDNCNLLSIDLYPTAQLAWVGQEIVFINPEFNLLIKDLREEQAKYLNINTQLTYEKELLVQENINLKFGIDELKAEVQT